MKIQDNIKRYKRNWQREQEAVRLYTYLANNEKNPSLKEVFYRLAENEKKHVAIWQNRLEQAQASPKQFRPGVKNSLLTFLVKILGSGRVIPLVAAIERDAANEYAGQSEPEIASMSQDEISHARIFNMIAKSPGGLKGHEVAGFEGRHRNGANALRAGVLGANDGLVSVFCLVMGVAGAGVGTNEILITGGAGLLAGALSMALGEWLSVQNARELWQYQLKIEEDELKESPEEELEELVLIYQAKGMTPTQAREMAEKILSDKDVALETLAREELGIDPKDLGGSAWTAAIVSFFLFSIGAFFPVFPYFFFSDDTGVMASAVSSTLALFVLGLVSSLITGRHWVFTSFRQVLIGWTAAGITFGLGLLFHVSLF